MSHGTNFSRLAADYAKKALVQRSAAETLMGLLGIGEQDDVLDLGCGTGHLTKRIRGLTRGKVVGVDAAEGMIRQARWENPASDITFELARAEELDYADAFDVIFCNSAFQWFRQPHRVIANCYRALRKNGRLGIQAPARQEYCPNFVAAVRKVARTPELRAIFAHWTSPWLFLESADEYRALFEGGGLRVPLARLETVKSWHSPDEVFRIFESGAAAGYLNQDFYSVPISATYLERFCQVVKEALSEQTDEKGGIELTFHRIFLIAVK